MIIEDQMILDSLDDCIFEELTTENFESLIFDYCNLDFFANNFATGASKGVLFLKDDDSKVVKIPLSHYESEVWNDEGEGNWEYKVIPFHGASCSNGNSWDYCRLECDIYEKAKEAGLEKYFLKTQCIGSVNSHPIYTQEKADNTLFEVKNYAYDGDFGLPELKKKHEGIDIYMIDPQWVYDFISFYGIDELVKLQDFLRENKLDRDLHSENIGYRDGKPILIDYSDYHN